MGNEAKRITTKRESKDLKRICFIVISGLPTPPVRGGAIEKIVQNIVEENEKNPHFYITVLTTKDEEAEKFDKDFVYTKYVRFQEHLWKNRLLFRFEKIKSKIKQSDFHFIRQEKFAAAEWLRENKDRFDLLIEENGMEVFWIGDKYIPHRKRVFHCHGNSDYNLANYHLVKNVLTVTQFVADEWEQKTETPPESIYPILNTINADEFTKRLDENEKALLRNKHGIQNDSFVLLYCGRIEENKGVRELIQAVNDLRDADITLLIAGSAYYKGGKDKNIYITELHRLAESSASQVIFLGYIENKELYKYHSITDACVIPSVWEEPAGLVCLESEVSGNATIASAIGGIPEMLPDQCGIKVPVDDQFIRHLSSAILKLKNDKELCKAFGRAGMKHVNDYGMREYFENFSRITDEIMRKENIL